MLNIIPYFAINPKSFDIISLNRYAISVFLRMEHRMRGRPAYTENAEEKAIHSYYTKILNSMPFLIYWVDESCNLQGFNANFGKLLNIFSPVECNHNHYGKLAKALCLTAQDAENLRIDDMHVIFSGKSNHGQIIHPSQKNHTKHYKFNRDPIISDQGQVLGAVITIMENEEPKLITPKNKKINNKSISTKKPKVLIVEDNATAQKVESTLFINLNCEVDAVESGAEAMKIFKPGKYNLVIMDIGLEDSSGYLLSRKFREMEENTKHHTAIVAITSYKPENVINDCKFYKMEGVVGKPLTEIQASQIIEHFIYNKENNIDGFS